MRAWWTGKDSNLRSPQGAADLQSAGFSHSPTRPVKTFWERELRVPNLSFNNLQPSRTKTQKGLVSRDTSPFIFPVGIRSALAPLQNSWWSWRRELNPRPSDYKSDALPAELRQRRSNRVRIAEGVSELQGGAAKYLARGWPALWKIAFPLITWTPVILSVIYSLAWNPLGRSRPNSRAGNGPIRSVFR